MCQTLAVNFKASNKNAETLTRIQDNRSYELIVLVTLNNAYYRLCTGDELAL